MVPEKQLPPLAVENGLLTVAESAKLLGLSRSKVYALMDVGELEYAKFGRCRRIPKSALTALIDRSLVRRNS